VTWSSSNPSIATVDAGGTVTGVAIGTATITATAETISGSASVTVTRQNFDHVFIVVLENRDFSDVVGNPNMPYYNSLAQQYGLATSYYADLHPSIGNYFMMTVGDTITDDDGWQGVITMDNVVRRLLAAGKTWKSYAENLPSQGYIGGDQGLYTRHHNPVTYFSDVVNDNAQRQNLVNFNQFASDVSANRLPDYVFLVPNSCSDGHDCSDATIDGWLSANLPQLISSTAFQNSLLIITFDESRTSSTNGGGRIPYVIVSPRAKRGYQSTTFYKLNATLRLSLEALGVNTWPNQGAQAPSMMEFFSR
jgi:acid phosphatase